MLANHLRRLERPIRYALDPVAEQAIHNWMRGQLIRRGLSNPAYSPSAPPEVAQAMQAVHGRSHDQLAEMLRAYTHHMNTGGYFLGHDLHAALADMVQQHGRRELLPGDHYAHQAYSQDTDAAEHADDESRKWLGRHPTNPVHAIAAMLGNRSAVRKSPVLGNTLEATARGAERGYLPHMLHLHHMMRTLLPGVPVSEAYHGLTDAIHSNVGIRDQHEQLGQLHEHALQTRHDRPAEMLPEDYYSLG